MLLPYLEGPKECWQAEMESVNREGLIVLAGQFFEILKGMEWAISRKTLEGWIHDAKRVGKSFAAIRRHQRYTAGPDKYIDEMIARSRAAKKAARRRKKGRR